MSGTETRLRELLEAAVGEPPGSISVPKVRRLARRRRTLQGITAASATAAFCAAVAVLASGLAAPLFGHSPSPRPGSSPRAGLPRYYVQAEFGIHHQRVLVRDTATGAVTATVRCPLAGARFTGNIASADDQAFFMACERTSESAGHKRVATRLYRFQLSRTGSIPGYSLVPGGTLTDLAGPLAAAANGSEIAVYTTTGPAAHASASVLVINTRTGAHAIWRGVTAPQFTLSPNGRYLTFVSLSRSPTGPIELCQVSPASRGGSLETARVLFHLPQQDTAPFYVRVSPDNSVLTLAAVQVRGPAIVEQIAVASGKVIRVLFRGTPRGGFNAFGASSDPTGRYIILLYPAKHGASNGWIEHGHLVPLAPAHATTLGYETW